jgi:hypothetical protein
MSFVIEAIGLRRSAPRDVTTSPVWGCTRMDDGAESAGGVAAVAGDGPAPSTGAASAATASAARRRPLTSGA